MYAFFMHLISSGSSGSKSVIEPFNLLHTRYSSLWNGPKMPGPKIQKLKIFGDRLAQTFYNINSVEK